MKNLLLIQTLLFSLNIYGQNPIELDIMNENHLPGCYPSIYPIVTVERFPNVGGYYDIEVCIDLSNSPPCLQDAGLSFTFARKHTDDCSALYWSNPDNITDVIDPVTFRNCYRYLMNETCCNSSIVRVFINGATTPSATLDCPTDINGGPCFDQHPTYQLDCGALPPPPVIIPCHIVATHDCENFTLQAVGNNCCADGYTWTFGDGGNSGSTPVSSVEHPYQLVCENWDVLAVPVTATCPNAATLTTTVTYQDAFTLAQVTTPACSLCINTCVEDFAAAVTAPPPGAMWQWVVSGISPLPAQTTYPLSTNVPSPTQPFCFALPSEAVGTAVVALHLDTDPNGTIANCSASLVIDPKLCTPPPCEILIDSCYEICKGMNPVCYGLAFSANALALVQSGSDVFVTITTNEGYTWTSPQPFDVNHPHYPPILFVGEGPFFINVMVYTINSDGTMCCDNCTLEVHPCPPQCGSIGDFLSHFNYYPNMDVFMPNPISSTMLNALVQQGITIDYTWSVGDVGGGPPTQSGSTLTFPIPTSYPMLGMAATSNPLIGSAIDKNICLTVHYEISDMECENTMTTCRDITFIHPPQFQAKKAVPALSVYPNPAKDNVMFKFPTTVSDETSYTVRKIDGSVVFQKKKIPTFSFYKSFDIFDLSGLNDGFYIYQVKSGKQTWNGKLEIVK